MVRTRKDLDSSYDKIVLDWEEKEILLQESKDFFHCIIEMR